MIALPVYGRPATAPSCWGYKFQDGDQECTQCPYNDSCKKEVLRGAISSPVPALPYGATTTMQPTLPFPRQAAYPQAAVQAPVPMPIYRPAPPPAPAPVQAYQYPPPPPQVQPIHYQQQAAPPPMQPYYQAMLPQETPDPSRPWVRPGAVSHPYYFTQYPGEHTAVRLGKNLILKAVAGALGELVDFFTQWTWPPRRDNNLSG